MPQGTIHFLGCIQDSQDYGSDDEHMVSRVFMTLEAGGQRWENLIVDVKQGVGESFETGPLEVSRPRGYDGSLDYATFREAVEKYYRTLMGSQASAIHIVSAKNVRMQNNRFMTPGKASFDYSSDSQAW